MIFDAIVDFHNVDTVMVDATSIRAHSFAVKLKVTEMSSSGALSGWIRHENSSH